MKKLGVIVDSSCGMSKKQCNDLGLYYIPLIIELDGQEYRSGIDIDNKFLYENLNKNSKVKTSAMKPNDFINLLDKVVAECEEVLVVTISKNLSSTNDLALTLTKNYDNVFVYDSKIMAIWFNLLIKPIAKLAKTGKKEEIIKLLDKHNEYQYSWIMPKGLDLLYAGGRITKIQYILGSLIKVSPIIPTNDGKISSKRTIKGKGAKAAIKRSIDELFKRQKELTDLGIETKVIVLKAEDDDKLNNLFINEIEQAGIKDYIFTYVSTETLAHVGKNPITIGLMVK